MVRRTDTTPYPRHKLLVTEEELRKIRAANKRRAKAMEKEVCRELNAHRTPLSGAGMVKGDGIVYLPHNMGIAIIECKVSSTVDPSRGPYIRFFERFHSKLESDVNAMRGLGAKFGFLVVKFHTWKDKYALIPNKYISIIEEICGIEIPRTDVVLPHRMKKDGTPQKMTSLHRRDLIENPGATVEHGDLYIATLKTLKGWLHDNN